MLIAKRLSVQQHAKDITQPIMIDVYPDVEAWGTNITRVVPSLVWRKTGATIWTTNSLVPYLDWTQVTGAWTGTNGAAFITVTNDATLVATNLPVRNVNAAFRDTVEYYLLLQYDPDDADPSRYNTDGSLKTPEARYYPDNAAMISNAWTCIGAVYTNATLTNTVSGISDVWINEVSRNNTADGADDFIELAGPTNTSLSGWTIAVRNLADASAKDVTYVLSGALTVGPTNGYAFFILGGASVPGAGQALTSALPASCGVTLTDAKGNIRYRLGFNGAAAGFETAVATNAVSWSACGKGNPAFFQYPWTGSGQRTAGLINDTVPPQELEPGGPVGLGVIDMTAEAADRIRLTVSDAYDPDGVATGRLYVVCGAVTNAVFGYSGTNQAEFVVSNLSENVRYEAFVVYTDSVGKEGYTARRACYTRLNTPPAPTATARTATSVTTEASVTNLPEGDTAAQFFCTSGAQSGWLKTPWTCHALLTNTVYGFSVKGRNGDGIETAISPTNVFCTLANAPTTNILLRSSTLNGSLTVSVTNLTGGATGEMAGAFGNPAYTRYMLVYTNGVSGEGKYVTTNGLAALTAGLSAQKTDAAWLKIGQWNDVAVFGLSLTNAFRLVARNEEGAETASGPAAIGLVTLQVGRPEAVQVAGVPQEVRFAGSFMNPAVAVTTNQFALQVSTNGGANWFKATIKSGSVTLGTGGTPLIDNSQTYPIRDVTTADYTNRITEGRWSVTNDLAAGLDYTVSLRLACSNAFASAVSGVTNLTIDLSAPTANLAGAPVGYTSATACSVTVGGAAVVAYKWRLERSPSYGAQPVWQDVSAWSATEVSVATPVSRTGLTNGCYRLSVIGRDAAGNWQAVAGAAQALWYVDLDAPTAVIVTAPPALTTNATVTFVLATEPPTNAVAWTYAVFKDSGALVGATNSISTNAFTVTVSDDGGYAVRIWARDQAGNVQAPGAPTIGTWTLDRLAPTALLIGTPAAYSAASALNVTVTNAASPGTTNTVTHYSWKLVRGGVTVSDWSAETAVSVKITQALSLDGGYTLSVIGRDGAGNWQTKPGTVYSWTRDTVSARAWFAVGPTLTNGYLAAESLAFTFGTSGETDAAEWRFEVTPGVTNAAAWTTNRSHTVTFATNGVYTLSAWGRDAAGNESAEATNVAVRVDTAAPTAAEVEVETTPALNGDGTSVLNGTALAFRVTVALPALFGGGTDAGATYRWQLNDGPTSAVTAVSVQTQAVSEAGAAVTNTLRVWAADWLGHAQKQPQTFTWTVDTVAPTAVYQVSPPANGIWMTNATWQVTVAGDAQVTAFKWFVDGAEQGTREISAPADRTFHVTGLSEAQHTLAVLGRDAAGNWQAADPSPFVKTVDVTPLAPAHVVLLGVPPVYTNATAANVTVTNAPGVAGSDTVAQWNWSLNGGVRSAPAANGVPVALAGILPNDWNTLSVWASDLAGNASLSPLSTTNWYVDTVAPTPATAGFAVTPLAVVASNSVTFTMVQSETNAVTWTYAVLNASGGLVGSTNTVSVNPFSVSGLAEGSYSIRIWATDRAGNRQADGTPTVWSWTVDLTPPSVLRWLGVPAHYTVSSTVSVSVTNEPDASVDAQLSKWVWVLNNGGPATRPDLATALGAGVFQTFSALTDGDYTLHVWAEDVAGNWNTSAFTTNWTVDQTSARAWFAVEPALTNGYLTAENLTFTFGTSGETDAAEWRFEVTPGMTNAAAWTTNRNHTVTFATNGVYTLSAWGRDAAGNESAEATNVAVRVDTAAPTAAEVEVETTPALNGDGTSVLNGTALAFRVTVALPALFGGGTDAGATYRWQLNDGPTSAVTAVSVQTQAVSEAGAAVTNTLRVWAADWLGHAQTQPQTFTWTVDTVAPTAVYQISPPANGIWMTNATWQVTVAGDAQVTAFKWFVDGAEQGTREISAPADRIFQVTGLSEAQHTLAVLGRDAAGNWQAADPSPFVKTVDVTSPTIPTLDVTPAAQDDTWQTNTVWTVTVVGEDVSAYRATLDEPAMPAEAGVPKATPYVTPALSQGPHTVRVWGCDAAGNWQTNPAVYTRSVDTAAPGVPVIELTPPANGAWLTNVNAQVSVSGTDVAYYRATLDDPAMPAAGDVLVAVVWGLTNLSQGAHTLRVWGRDEAGNWQLTPAVYTKTVDTLAPSAGYQVSPPANGNWMTNAIWTVTLTGAVDMVAYRYTVDSPTMPSSGETAVGTLPQQFLVSTLSEGSHTLRVWGRDEAGNWQAAASVFAKTVDTRYPETVRIIDTPPALSTVSNWTFRVEAGDVAYYRWKLDAGSLSGEIPASQSFEVRGLTDGSHTVYAWGRDDAGNWNPLATNFTWTVDATPPATGAKFVAEGMPIDPTNRPDVVVMLARDSDIAEWKVTLKKQVGVYWTLVTNVWVANSYGGTLDTTNRIHTLAADGSQDGVYRLEAVGRDAAGNWQASPTADGIYDWTYDRTPPVAVFAVKPASPTNITVAAFVVSNKVEQIDRWRYRVRSGGTNYLDWTETGATTFSVTVGAARADGVVYTCEVQGRDVAGNWQTNVEPQDGWADWQVVQKSAYISKVLRNTTVTTNGNLHVELMFWCYAGIPLTTFTLNERLPVSVSSLSWTYSDIISTPNLTSPSGGNSTNVANWLIYFNKTSNYIARITYEIPGLTANTITGTLSWSENSVVRTYYVERGTHVSYLTNEVPSSGYSAWAAAYGLGNNSETGDPDGDGLTNEGEYWADTDPTNALSKFVVCGVSRGGTSRQLSVQAGQSANLEVGWKAALTNTVWTAVTPDVSSYQGTNVWLLTLPVEPQSGGLPSSRVFIRVWALPK